MHLLVVMAQEGADAGVQPPYAARMTTLQVEPAPVVRWEVWDRSWTLLRWALVVAAAGMLVVAVLTGDRRAGLGELEDALRSGAVESVTVVGGLPPGSVGSGVQEVLWQDGLLTRRSPVWQSSDGTAPPAGEGPPVVTPDVGHSLHAAHPGREVRREEHQGAWSEVVGFRLSGAAATGALVVLLGALTCLVVGPPPWRATRWAWFWLLLTPPGLLAFLLLGGPGPLTGPHPGARRLTGGRALLLALLLGALGGGVLGGP